jgi:hypothetical protein
MCVTAPERRRSDRVIAVLAAPMSTDPASASQPLSPIPVLVLRNAGCDRRA